MSTKGFTYKSYSFLTKDPIIDEVRTIVQMSGFSYLKIEEHSGVTSQTLRAWFQGKTRKPQAATLNAVARALGYKLGFVPYEAASAVQPTPVAISERSMGHVVRMAKIRRAK
jgi:transcriptional regulator with XRE-family HTH domain